MSTAIRCPVRLADEAVCIGPAAAARSYNNIPAVISAAMITGCDADSSRLWLPRRKRLPGGDLPASGADVHRSYSAGHRAHGQQGRSPPRDARGRRADAAWHPGHDRHPVAEAREFARHIGYPVVVKAVAGGGGRGMRVAMTMPSWSAACRWPQAEAEAAFGNGAVYMERYLQKPRHVEVQVLGDNHGNVIAVGERDCSLQRRHQKVVEEAPAPNLPRKIRDNLLKTAVKGARAAELHQRRHARVPARQRGPVLLHGNEHPDPGRAPDHRGNREDRSRRLANPGCRRGEAHVQG